MNDRSGELTEKAKHRLLSAASSQYHHKSVQENEVISHLFMVALCNRADHYIFIL